jgi:hypothetical protein
VFGPRLDTVKPALLPAVSIAPLPRHHPQPACQFRSGLGHAFAIAEARECVNPRPRAYANIFRRSAGDHQIHLFGRGNDDVNKAVWSDLGCMRSDVTEPATMGVIHRDQFRMIFACARARKLAGVLENGIEPHGKVSAMTQGDRCAELAFPMAIFRAACDA